MRKENIEQFTELIFVRYKAQTNIEPAIYIFTPADGAGEVFMEE